MQTRSLSFQRKQVNLKLCFRLLLTIGVVISSLGLFLKYSPARAATKPNHPHHSGRQVQNFLSVKAYQPSFIINGPIIEWNTFIGSGNDSSDYSQGIATDSSGNIYIIGSSSSTWGNPVNNYEGNRDIFVAKINNAGILQWNTFLGDSADDSGSDIAVDENGNIYIVGCIDRGFDACFMAKLNNAGERLWINDLQPYPQKITVDGNENIYISGRSSVTWGNPINPHMGINDAFVAKFNNTGQLQWNTFLGSENDDTNEDIAVDSVGNIYVSGASPSTWGNPKNSHTGEPNVYVAKLNNSGALQWNTFFETSTLIGSRSGIDIDNIGNVYISGSSYSSWGNPINPFAGSFDNFVSKLNSDGIRQWNTFLGSADLDESFSIVLDKDENIYVAGNSDATWGNPFNSFSGSYDIYLAKLNNAGVLQWNTFYGSPVFDGISGIAIDSNGSILVSGLSNATWGSPVNPFAGDNDVLVVKINLIPLPSVYLPVITR